MGACYTTCMSKPGNLWRQVHGRITSRPTNFSWVIEENLAGSGKPTTKNEFNWIISQGIQSVVTMTEDALPAHWVSGTVEYLHVPTPDLTAPDLERLDGAVDFIHEQIKDGRAVMVHCAAGLGRAGTVLASYLVKYAGYTAESAITEIRAKRPGSIQSEVQELAVEFFAKSLQGDNLENTEQE